MNRFLALVAVAGALFLTAACGSKALGTHLADGAAEGVAGSGGVRGSGDASDDVNSDSALVQSDTAPESNPVPRDAALEPLKRDAGVDKNVGPVGRDAAGHESHPLACNGTSVLGGPPLPVTGATPTSVAVGDLDGDGTLDVVTANFDEDTVSVLRGAGGGKLAAKVDYLAGTHPISVALGDLDGDGHLDAVVANRDSPSVSVLRGIGNGKLAQKVDYSAGADPHSVAMGDLNHDGKLDVAVVNLTYHSGPTDTVSVLLGSGDGKLGKPVSYPTGEWPESLAIGDVNGDGTLDLVTVNWGSSVSVLAGKGDGTFAAKVDYGTSYQPIALALGDLNGDGALDVVAVDSTAEVSVLLGTGNGKLATHVDYPTGQHAEDDNPVDFCRDYGNSPNSVALADLNGDGTLDIVEANSRGGDVSVLLGNGDGTFAAQAEYATGGSTLSLALADMDGDGVLDLVATNGDASTVAVLPGQGDGSFDSGAEKTDYPIDCCTMSGALGDLNGDGRLDVVVTSRPMNAPLGTGEVSVLLGTDDGGFAAAVSYPASDPRSVALGDVNGDGKLDVIALKTYSASGKLSPSVGVFLGTGTGELVAVVDYPTREAPSALALGDLNGDGRLDIVTASDPSSVGVLLGTGGGQFAASVEYATGAGLSVLALGDLDGDGKLDVVASGTNCPTTSVLLGRGDGTLAAKVDFEFGFVASLAPGDMNGDGNLDVVTANQAGAVSVLVGKGDGTFAEVVDYPTGSAPDSVAVVDINGDGLLDVLATSSTSDSVHVFLGTDGGKLADKLTFLTGTPYSLGWLALGDVNRDGRVDLVFSSIGGPVSVILNTCP